MAQWWPLATQNDEDSRSLVRSFLDAFPYATLWTTEFHEMLLVGSEEPIELDAANIAARYNQRTTSRAVIRSPRKRLFQRIGIGGYRNPRTEEEAYA
jgi:spermidine synthase